MSENPQDAKGHDPLIGRLINDRYKIVSVIARGGMGKVYRAEQAPLGRQVALKVLNPNYQGDSDPEFHRRFFLEASTSAKLTHPNTVTVFDYGRTDDDVYYIAMELLEGRTLHRALKDDGPFMPERALHIARQICRSLREAHGMGIIHRDLKPANVFLMQHGDENDFVKVLDFGLVKDLDKEGEDLTQTGLFMGSPKYMSPEQIRGERVDARTDVYSLGVMVYEMLTGKVPFDRANSVNILMAHVHEAAPSLNTMLPGTTFTDELIAIVMKAMAKQQDDRYANMDEFFNALKGAGSDVLSVTRSSEHSGSNYISASLEMDADAIASGASASFTNSVLTARPAPSASNTPKLVAGLLVVAALVGGGLALSRKSDSATTPAPGSGTAAATAPALPATAPAPGPAAPNVVRLELRSEPSGASVLIGDRNIATTPADLEWTGADAELGRQVTFTFRLPDHRDYTVMRTVRGDTMNVLARLEPSVDPRRPTATTRPREGTTEPAGREPRRGFHLNPY